MKNIKKYLTTLILIFVCALTLVYPTYALYQTSVNMDFSTNGSNKTDQDIVVERFTVTNGDYWQKSNISYPYNGEHVFSKTIVPGSSNSQLIYYWVSCAGVQNSNTKTGLCSENNHNTAAKNIIYPGASTSDYAFTSYGVTFGLQIPNLTSGGDVTVQFIYRGVTYSSTVTSTSTSGVYNYQVDLAGALLSPDRSKIIYAKVTNNLSDTTSFTFRAGAKTYGGTGAIFDVSGDTLPTNTYSEDMAMSGTNATSTSAMLLTLDSDLDGDSDSLTAKTVEVNAIIPNDSAYAALMGSDQDNITFSLYYKGSYHNMVVKRYSTADSAYIYATNLTISTTDVTVPFTFVAQSSVLSSSVTLTPTILIGEATSSIDTVTLVATDLNTDHVASDTVDYLPIDPNTNPYYAYLTFTNDQTSPVNLNSFVISFNTTELTATSVGYMVADSAGDSSSTYTGCSGDPSSYTIASTSNPIQVGDIVTFKIQISSSANYVKYTGSMTLTVTATLVSGGAGTGNILTGNLIYGQGSSEVDDPELDTGGTDKISYVINNNLSTASTIYLVKVDSDEGNNNPNADKLHLTGISYAIGNATPTLLSGTSGLYEFTTPLSLAVGESLNVDAQFTVDNGYHVNSGSKDVKVTLTVIAAPTTFISAGQSTGSYTISSSSIAEDDNGLTTYSLFNNSGHDFTITEIRVYDTGMDLNWHSGVAMPYILYNSTQTEGNYASWQDGYKGVGFGTGVTIANGGYMTFVIPGSRLAANEAVSTFVGTLS
ncbi:MAG: hypothetical protein PHY11_03895 [Bacilli bacterium]|nr:hypothetical protein [Bacilli bacterium]